MEKTEKKQGKAQGAKTLTESEFRKMVETDLRTAYSFLAAVHNDKATLDALNEYLYGRYLNQLHKAELESQTKIEA